MKIEKIKVRGITTFKDEAELDLSALGSGLIAVAGPNGAGKSSLLESIPGALYRQTPSRGPVAALATARNSRIEISGVNGTPFSVCLDIDAHTGKSEAVLSDGDGKPVAGPKVRDYDAAVAEKFPPLSVYLAALFSCQTGAGSLLHMERSERRDLFGRLLGLERLEELAGAARERVRMAENEAAMTRVALEALRGQVEDTDALGRLLEEVKRQIGEAREALAQAQDKLAKAMKYRDELTAAKAEAEKTQKAVAEAQGRVDRAAAGLDRLEGQLAQLNSVLSQAAQIREHRAKLEAAVEALEKSRIAGEAAAAEDRDLQERAAAAERKIAELERGADVAKRNFADAQKSLGQAKSAIVNAEASTGAVPCAGVLEDGARSACPALKGHFKTRTEAERVIVQVNATIGDLELAADTAAKTHIHALTNLPASKAKATAARARVDSLRLEYRHLSEDIAKFKAGDQSEGLARAEAERKAIEPSLEAAQKAVDLAIEEHGRLELAIVTVDPAVLLEVETEIMALNDEIKAAQQSTSEVEIRAARLETRIQAARQVQDKIKDLEAKAAPIETEIAQWRFLARGLGREGVQALELDAAGPQVSALANELLADAYGPRFQVRFETQAARADGKGVKETFDVVVVDNERGREGNGEDLSGGEKVIIGEALGLAVGLFHAQSAGIQLGTVIRDETVGALDPENGERYLAMLRAFLRIGHVHQLLYVAHQPALIDMADAVIRVEDGRIEVK